MKLEQLYNKKRNVTQIAIPKSEAKKDFWYQYANATSVADSELRDAIEWLFTKRGYIIVNNLDSLNEEQKEKLIIVEAQYTKDDKSKQCVTILGKNIKSQITFSVTKKGSSLAKAREEAFEALKQ